MARDLGQDWRAQLSQLRDSVEEMERRREEEKRLQLERNREALQERLRRDTPENLSRQMNEVRDHCDRAARRFYPIESIEGACAELRDFDKRLQFYKDCQKEFGDLFTDKLVRTIDRCKADIANIERGLERQLAQWRAIRDVLNDVAFRPKCDADNAPLVAAAKDFSQRAHGMGLAIPEDFFAAEGENFRVTTHQENVIGYVKYWPDRDVITFALKPPVKLNFPKFVRGVLYRAYRQGPLSDKPRPAVRVRLGMAKEVKFFTDLGLVRSETVSVSEWVYERPLD